MVAVDGFSTGGKTGAGDGRREGRGLTGRGVAANTALATVTRETVGAVAAPNSNERELARVPSSAMSRMTPGLREEGSLTCGTREATGGWVREAQIGERTPTQDFSSTPSDAP